MTASVEEETVGALLLPGGVTAVFQPIVSLVDRRVVGWEALGRTTGGRDVAPDVALAMAQRVGRATDLEVAFWDAVAAVGPPPPGTDLFVNLGASALGDPRLEDRLLALPGHVVVEITEQAATAGDGQLRDTVRRWAADGVRFAVDDAGAGFSSLRRIVDLAPAFLKVDASLVHGSADDPRLQAALVAMSAFAAAVDAVLVAEGVERPGDLRVLEDVGVELAQGFLLGRPGPPWLPG